jgi:hypothetical protein
MAKYYKIRKQAFPYSEVAESSETEEARGLNGRCENHHSKKHQWLLLPREEGQKQYVFCLTCFTFSHL